MRAHKNPQPPRGEYDARGPQQQRRAGRDYYPAILLIQKSAGALRKHRVQVTDVFDQLSAIPAILTGALWRSTSTPRGSARRDGNFFSREVCNAIDLVTIVHRPAGTWHFFREEFSLKGERLLQWKKMTVFGDLSGKSTEWISPWILLGAGYKLSWYS